MIRGGKTGRDQAPERAVTGAPDKPPGGCLEGGAGTHPNYASVNFQGDPFSRRDQAVIVMGTWRPETRQALILEQTGDFLKKLPDTAKVGITDIFTYKARGRCVLLRMMDYKTMWELIKAVKATNPVHPQTG